MLSLLSLPVERFCKLSYKRQERCVGLVHVMLNQDKEIGGQPIHVRDCYVWAEIYYLDSLTNYREYLPLQQVEPSTVRQDDFVTLDSPRKPSNHTGGWKIPGLFFVIAGLLLCLILYLFA